MPTAGPLTTAIRGLGKSMKRSTKSLQARKQKRRLRCFQVALWKQAGQCEPEAQPVPGQAGYVSAGASSGSASRVARPRLPCWMHHGPRLNGTERSSKSALLPV